MAHVSEGICLRLAPGPGGARFGSERGQRSARLLTSDSCRLICSTPPIATGRGRAAIKCTSKWLTEISHLFFITSISRLHRQFFFPERWKRKSGEKGADTREEPAALNLKAPPAEPSRKQTYKVSIFSDNVAYPLLSLLMQHRRFLRKFSLIFLTCLQRLRGRALVSSFTAGTYC